MTALIVGAGPGLSASFARALAADGAQERADGTQEMADGPLTILPAAALAIRKLVWRALLERALRDATPLDTPPSPSAKPKSPIRLTTKAFRPAAAAYSRSK